MQVFSSGLLYRFGLSHSVEFTRHFKTSLIKCSALDPKELNQFKRGTGGRSSFNGKIVTVFGATGYVGRHLISNLAKSGTQIIIPYRGDPYYIRDLKVVGDLGQIWFYPFHLEDDESLRNAMRFSNVVVNLISKEIDTLNFTIEQVNIDSAARLARISKECGVERFIHLSSLSQNENPQKYIWKPSRLIRSKALGEKEVLRERNDATIFRPADVWGERDRFLCYYAHKARRFGSSRVVYVPLWNKGVDTVKQPVHVGDLVRGIINSISDTTSIGKTYEAIGPHRYRLDDLVKWLLFICRYLPQEVHVTNMNLLFLGRVLLDQKLNMHYPLLNMERLEMECVTDVPSGCPTLSDLNVNLKKLEDYVHHIVYLFRRFNVYWDALGEFPEPPNPPLQA